MATLQKFKNFAIQCGASQSPARSPVVHLRRRKTSLRTLLSCRCREPALRRECLLEKKKKGGDQVWRHSLKDLFLSSPSDTEDAIKEDTNSNSENSNANTVLFGSVYGSGSPKPGWTGFRYRSLLSKRAWRPILLTITE